MTKYLLVLLLTCSFTTIAQQKSDSIIAAFEDYSQCYSGFINKLGDTVWPAQFTGVGFDDLINEPFWWVWKNERIGIMNQYGKMLIEPTLEKIQPLYNDDYYLVNGDGKFGIVDLHFRPVVPIEYDSISMAHTYSENSNWELDHYLFSENGKYGIMNDSFQVIIASKFDSLGSVCIRYDGSESHRCYPFMIMKQQGKLGLVAMDGSIVIPPKYKSIVPFSFNPYIDVDPMYLMVENDAGQKTILNENFDEVVPFSDKVYPFGNYGFRVRSCKPLHIKYAYIEWEDSAKVFNILNGKHSKAYEKLAQFDKYVLFMQKGQWGILDTNFEEVYSGGEHYPSAQNGMVHTVGWSQDQRVILRNPDYYYYYNRKEQSLCSKEHFIWQSEIATNDLGDKNFARPIKQSIVNFKTGKSLPQTHERVYVRYKNETPFLWGIDCVDGAANIVIYDGNMEKLRELNGFLGPVKGISHALELANVFLNNRDAILFDQNGKCGVISSDGIISLPFEYNRIYAHGNYPNSEGGMHEIYAASKDSMNFVIDERGEVLLSSSAYIEKQDYGWFVRDQPIALLYDRQFNVVFDDISSFGFVPNPKHGRYASEFFSDQMFYVNEGKLYFAKGIELTLMDRKQFPFDDKCYVYANKMLIDKKGHALFALPHWEKPFVVRNRGGYVAKSKRLIVYFDNNGEELRRIDGIKETFDGGPDVIIYFEDDTWAVISAYDGEWLIPKQKKYSQILRVENQSKIDSIFFWGLDDNNQWHLINSKGEEPFPYTFDTTENFGRGNYLIPRLNGKLGILHTNGKVIMPFEIDAVQYLRNLLLFRKGNHWSIMDKGNQVIQNDEGAGFDAVADAPNNVLVVFRNDSIGSYDINLDVLNPMMGMNQYRSDSLPFAVNRNQEFPWNDGIAGFHYAYNEALLRHVQLNLITNQPYASEVQEKVKLKDPKGWAFQSSAANRWYTLRQYRREINYRKDVVTTNTYHQLEFTGDSLISLNVRDMFENPDQFDVIFDELLAETIQREQLYGVACPNLPVILEEMKKNIVFRSQGMEFHDGGQKALILPWEIVKPYLSQDCQNSIDEQQMN